MVRYDLVVLGGGAAGEKGAAQAAWFGKRVAVVEAAREPGGATAAATVPSKTLRETALTLSGFKARRLHGVELGLGRDLTVQDFLRHERAVKAAERERIRTNLSRHGVELVQGHGRFVDPHTLEVTAPGLPTRLLEAEHVLVATGSRPRWPAGLPASDAIFDSETILELTRLPRRLAILGGGVIGCEYACVFAALGVAVRLVHARPRLLEFLDRDLSARLETAMWRAGIELALGSRMVSVRAEAGGLALELEGAGPWQGDTLLLAIGRDARTEGLGLEVAGVATCDHGRIRVDHRYRTTAPHVAAAGDVIGPPALASTSMEQARTAVISLLSLPAYKDGLAPILPTGIYTIPEISAAGLTAEEAAARGIETVTGVARYDHNVRGMIVGDRDGFLKLVFARDGMKLLGVHALGEGATELVHLGLVALATGAGADLFIDLCFNYPTLGELYKYATYAALGEAARLAGSTPPGVPGPASGS